MILYVKQVRARRECGNKVKSHVTAPRGGFLCLLGDSRRQSLLFGCSLHLVTTCTSFSHLGGRGNDLQWCPGGVGTADYHLGRNPTRFYGSVVPRPQLERSIRCREEANGEKPRGKSVLLGHSDQPD